MKVSCRVVNELCRLEYVMRSRSLLPNSLDVWLAFQSVHRSLKSPSKLIEEMDGSELAASMEYCRSDRNAPTSAADRPGGR